MSMNILHPSTQLPVAGLGVDNATPAEFLDFLRSLTTLHLGDDRPRITDNTASWVTIVDGLTDHFLGTFPIPDIVAWGAMEEKVEVTRATLEVIRRAFLRVDGIHNSTEELLRKLFARLLDLCRVLDVWVEGLGEEDGMTTSPRSLRDAAFSALKTVLRSFGDANPAPADQNQPMAWIFLRKALNEALDLCNDLILVPAPLDNFAVIALFRKPRILSPKDHVSFVSSRL
ncbi:hypothetical protein CPB83DRAFT_204155 [Crepidotus variabilis]|uniref:Uncharacterized protein n=1 Tax=Crepidotus variabilis TaxID=179855 RepID=A0A9P6ESZ2_9AGAR|nr:hypothetical protein CPB83DRAFT_204155 [Crepidotus variabilis]